jgi:sugar lactone lactonase YvrE
LRTLVLLLFAGLGGLSAAAAQTPAQPAPTGALASQSDRALAAEGRAAHKRGDNAAFLANYEELNRRHPGNIFTLYNLACARALNGRGDEAVRALEEILVHRVATNLDREPALESIRQTSGYQSVLARMNAFRKERISSGAVRAFTIPEKGFIAEGVAYDSVRRSFFLGSIRHRKIVRIDAAGNRSDFVSPARDGLMSALGMRVDPVRRVLWVASQAFPSMDGYREDEKKPSAVFEYDADSGRLRRKHVAPSGDAPPAFDDLTISADGTVFVNDTDSGRIWAIPPGRTLQVFLESEAIEGTQGMAVSENGKTLYVSDYQGLFAIDLASRRVTPLSVPADLSLSGIDGLARSGGSLVAIQNGVIPHRVIRIDLTSDGLTIASSRILEMNHPDFDEPTLGVVVDGALYFSADSQGQKFLDPKHPIRPEEMRDAVILKLPLMADRAK